MNKIKVPQIQKQAIELYGLHGEFQIPDSKYMVRYFSTFANNRTKGQGPHLLLKELRPMRERVEPQLINDLSSLLQRDLNDSRVANELVPYLLGKKSGIAFFPAILAVLIPKDFLISKDNTYPRRQDKSNEEVLNYNINKQEFWQLEILNNTPLGILKIYSENSDIIVLDGQHRSNAFRVVTGDFFEYRNAELYQPFYQGIQKQIQDREEFKADLPVTLIWFEFVETNNTTLDPALISRKLFVDVNNTAKPVSESRTILLNDYEPSSVLTRLFYSLIAKSAGFQPERFSLLHNGLDIDSDLRYSNPHVFTLTTPQIIHHAVDWVFFGTRYHVDLGRHQVKRETARIDTSQCKSLLSVFGKYIKLSGEEDSSKYFEMNTASMEEIEEEFERTAGLVFQRIFDEFNFLQIHYQAAGTLFSERDNWGSTTKKEVLDKVFCGGEGLYYAYRNIPKTRISGASKDIRSAMDEIETEFKSKRKRLIEQQKKEDVESKRIDAAFESFRTKAFQVGLFMTFYHFQGLKQADSNEYQSNINEFLKRLNSISPVAWINILTELKPAIIRQTDPKRWPAYHKIILRVIQRKGEFFDRESNSQYSPEVFIFKNRLDEKLEGWCNANNLEREELEYQQIDETIRNEWYESITEDIENLYKRCELKVLPHIDFAEVGTQFLKESLNVKNEEEMEEEED